ncbi:GNAT family N-acetyltransferase, partial [Streptomyces albidoflavus]
MSEPPTADPQTVDVRDDAEANRYEARVDGQLAGTAQYIRTPGLVAFVHTEVDPAYEGHGVGGGGGGPAPPPRPAAPPPPPPRPPPR